MTREAIIYCRVSSERQVKEGGGLASQEQRCRLYAQSLGYTVTSVFSDDGVSGAVIERPGIQSMLGYLRSKGNEVVVVIDDISRIARDMQAHMVLRTAIRVAGGKLESPSHTFGETASDELVEGMLALMAQYGRKGNREQVLNRQKARLQMGYWTFPAPQGYHYGKHPVHRKLIVPSDQARMVLGPALDGFASGRFRTNRDLARHLLTQGFFKEDRLSVLEKRVTRIFDVLPLYAGFIEYPAWQVERGDGNHQAIISPATLSLLEERLRRREKVSGLLRVDAAEAFPLRNFVRCPGCSRPFTGSLAKGKYPRYYCYNQTCERYGQSITARVMEPDFEDLLLSAEPTDNFMEMVRILAGNRWKQRVAEWGTEGRAIDAAIQRDAEEKQGLVRRLGKVSDDVAPAVEAEITKLAAQIAANEGALAKIRLGPPDFEAAFARVSTLYRNPHDHWKSGLMPQKRTVHALVFTVPPAYDRKTGFSTYHLTLPYQLSASFRQSSSCLVDLTAETWHRFIHQILDWACLPTE